VGIVVVDLDELTNPANPGRRKEMDKGRGSTFALVDEVAGARNVDVHLNVLRPGGGLGNYHYHERAENIYIILEGRARMIVEGEEHFAGANQVVFIPPGVRHATANAGDTPLRLIEIYAPGGPDFHVVDLGTSEEQTKG
jgi:mannose-6-phosphate isomerase-like protein (cupin superfamily)